MKLKMIALAAVMVASGAANAALTVSTGNNSLFFNAWTDNGSYTLKLSDYTVDSFASGIAATGNFSQSFGDAGLSSFLSGLTAYSWNILASDISGQTRVISTFSSTPATTLKDDSGRSVAAAVNQFAIAANNAGLNSADSITVDKTSPAYAGKTEGGSSVLNFVNTGGITNNSYDNGLGLRVVTSAGTGLKNSVYTTYTDGAVGVKAWVGSDNKLNIAAVTAVPEPETYALLLAGLGLMGTIIRRRQRNA